jgi:hypothetical protein
MRELIEHRIDSIADRRPVPRTSPCSPAGARAALVALVIGMAGCATVPASMPVSGSASDVARLAGDWSGEYWGGPSGRTGAISFHLAAGSDSAQGTVTMAYPGAPPGVPRSVGGDRVQVMIQELNISFVRAEAGGVTGRIDPYTDPACDCTAFTTFNGRIQGDVIDGTFTTSHGTGSSIATGKWKVKRRKA